MGEESRPEHVKIVVDLPNHWYGSGEGLWAVPLGGSRYRIDNIPFLAYGLNCADVVEAIATSPDQKPLVRRVLEYGGHRTLRVFVPAEREPEGVSEFLRGLSDLGVSFERMKERFFALDVPPEGDYERVFEVLGEKETAGDLYFETCEARVVDSFDDAPSEEE